MRLESSTWISTTISGVYHELARIEGFKLLLAYMQGQNEYGNPICKLIEEPRHKKTGFLPMRKQRRRSAVQ